MRITPERVTHIENQVLKLLGTLPVGETMTQYTIWTELWKAWPGQVVQDVLNHLVDDGQLTSRFVGGNWHYALPDTVEDRLNMRMQKLAEAIAGLGQPRETPATTDTVHIIGPDGQEAHVVTHYERTFTTIIDGREITVDVYCG